MVKRFGAKIALKGDRTLKKKDVCLIAGGMSCILMAAIQSVPVRAQNRAPYLEKYTIKAWAQVAPGMDSVAGSSSTVDGTGPVQVGQASGSAYPHVIQYSSSGTSDLGTPYNGPIANPSESDYMDLLGADNSGHVIAHIYAIGQGGEIFDGGYWYRSVNLPYWVNFNAFSSTWQNLKPSGMAEDGKISVYATNSAGIEYLAVMSPVKPNLAISSPTNGATYTRSQTINLTANLADSKSYIASGTWMVAGGQPNSMTVTANETELTAQIALQNWTWMGAGPYVITVQAICGDGTKLTKTVTIYTKP